MKPSMKGCVWVLGIVLAGASLAGWQPCAEAQSSSNAARGTQIRGEVLDAGGEVFDVKAYGATGNGTTDDTAAIQAAISAAGAGTVYFPAGTYSYTTVHILNISTSLVGAGSNATTLRQTASGGIVVDVSTTPPYQGGTIKGIRFDSTAAPAGSIALHVVDSVGWVIKDNSFVGAAAKNDIGIEFENRNGFNERHDVESNQFFEDNPSIKMLQDAGDGNGFTFGYLDITADHFQIPEGGAGLLIDGGNTGKAYWYNSVIELKANLDGSTGHMVMLENKVTSQHLLINIQGEAGGDGICTDSRTSLAGDDTVLVDDMGDQGRPYCPGANIDAAGSLGGASTYTLSNWNGTGSSATAWPIGEVSTPGQSNGPVFSYFGAAVGPNLISPFVTMYAYPGNAFTIGTIAWGSNLSHMNPVASVDAYGNGSFAGGVYLGSGIKAAAKIGWTHGPGAPTGACGNGSLYSNTAGSRGSTLYVCVSGTWVDVK
jgi:Pectate lyase superfamily protein